MTPLAGVLVGICPSEEAGASLAPAGWPDQKPVRPVGRDPSQSCRQRFSSPGRHRILSPNLGWRSFEMLAEELDFVVGVDPHRDEHAIAVVEVRSGVLVFESSVIADRAGYAEALRVAEQHAPGRRAFAIEGAGSFGAGLSRFLAERGEQVFEVGRLRRQRRSQGKTDALDAVRAARSVFEQKRPARPRSSGEREALRALAARDGAVNAKRAGLCQLRDLLV